LVRFMVMIRMDELFKTRTITLFLASHEIRSKRFHPMNQGRVQEVFGKRAEGYAVSASHADPEVLGRVSSLCGDLSGRTVLDVATGTGHTAIHLALHARIVVGLDLTERMLELARSAGEDRALDNLRWVRGDVMALPFPDASFDAVCSRRAPHHFPHLGPALLEMFRVLRPGGRLVIDDRSVPDDPEVDEMMNRLDKLHDPSHVREYSVEEWRKELSKAGFNVQEVQEYRRHLPITSLTGNAEPDDAKEIGRVVGSMPKDLRQRMSVRESEGIIHLDHYFVTLQATK